MSKKKNDALGIDAFERNFINFVAHNDQLWAHLRDEVDKIEELYENTKDGLVKSIASAVFSKIMEDNLETRLIELRAVRDFMNK